jgi:hypothetical protein
LELAGREGLDAAKSAVDNGTLAKHLKLDGRGSEEVLECVVQPHLLQGRTEAQVDSIDVIVLWLRAALLSQTLLKGADERERNAERLAEMFARQVFMRAIYLTLDKRHCYCCVVDFRLFGSLLPSFVRDCIAEMDP